MPGTREAILRAARRWIGTMYVWGGESAAEGGVDCSGLIIDAYRQAGVPLRGDPNFRPIASQIGRMGKAIELDRAQPGDVLYYDNPGPTDHVALYVGGGQMIEAPTVGQKVRVSMVRTPTSVRRLEEAGIPRGVGQEASAWDNITNPQVYRNAVGDLVGDWTGGAMRVGIYVVGALAAAGLVVGGVMQTVKKE